MTDVDLPITAEFSNDLARTFEALEGRELESDDIKGLIRDTIGHLIRAVGHLEVEITALQRRG
jgi:hypothetical protein